jgi:hypothetical protein
MGLCLQVNGRAAVTKKVRSALKYFHFSTFDVNFHEADILGLYSDRDQIFVDRDHLNLYNARVFLHYSLDVSSTAEKITAFGTPTEGDVPFG